MGCIASAGCTVPLRSWKLQLVSLQLGFACCWSSPMLGMQFSRSHAAAASGPAVCWKTGDPTGKQQASLSPCVQCMEPRVHRNASWRARAQRSPIRRQRRSLLQIDDVAPLLPGLIWDAGEDTSCGSGAPIAVTQLNAWSLAHRRRGREPRCLLAANLGAVLGPSYLL